LSQRICHIADRGGARRLPVQFRNLRRALPASQSADWESALELLTLFLASYCVPPTQEALIRRCWFGGNVVERFFCAAKRLINIGADVLAAHHFLKFRLMH